MGDYVDPFNVATVAGGSGGKRKRVHVDDEDNAYVNNLYYRDINSVRRSVRDGLLFIDTGSFLSYGGVRGGDPSVSGPVNDAAIASAFASGVKNITFPCGTYYFSSTINVPTELTLEGESKNCVIIGSSATTAITTDTFSVVRNLLILNQSGVAGDVAIDLQDSQQAVVENVRTGALSSNIYDYAIKMTATATNANANYVANSILNGNVSSVLVDGSASNAYGNVFISNTYGTLSPTTDIVHLIQSSGTFIGGGTMNGGGGGATNGINLDTGTRNSYISLPSRLGTVTNLWIEAEIGDNVVRDNLGTISATRYEGVNPASATAVKYNLNDLSFANVNVLSFGAIAGDDPANAATNDAAFADALSKVPGMVMVPCGVYHLSAPLVVPTDKSIVGSSLACPVIKSSADVIIEVNTRSRIRNLELQYTGANTTTSVGMLLDGSFYSTVENVVMEVSYPHTGLSLTATATSVNSNYFAQCSFTGLEYGCVIDGTASRCAWNRFFECRFRTDTGASNVVLITDADETTFISTSLSGTTTNGINVAAGDNNMIIGIHLILSAVITNPVVITPTTGVYINNDGTIILKGVPTASAGLPSGSVWSNANVLTLVP